MGSQSLLFFSTPDRKQADLLLAQLDFVFVTWVEFQHGGVCLADQKVADP
jgi:hypothetical protein